MWTVCDSRSCTGRRRLNSILAIGLPRFVYTLESLLPVQILTSGCSIDIQLMQ